MLYDFFTDIELGSWRARDPRTMQTDKYLAPDESRS
jgi:hypothetical protein